MACLGSSSGITQRGASRVVVCDLLRCVAVWWDKRSPLPRASATSCAGFLHIGGVSIEARPVIARG